MDSCAKHPHERGVALCRRCGDAWCKRLPRLRVRGQEAAVLHGLRDGGRRRPHGSAARPAMPRRELKALQKAAKADAKAAAKAAKDAPEPVLEDEQAVAAVAVAPVEVAPAAPAGTGWETPWWEDRQPTFAD